MTPASPRSRIRFLTLVLFVGALALLGVTAPSAAQAANLTVGQCNGVGASAMGATTAMRCDITVVNTINGSHTDSRTTMTRHCALGPCPPGNGTFVTNSTNLVTNIQQCNGSDNDAAHPIRCDVTVINNIAATTPGAKPITAATVNECVGSATGGGGSKVCTPYPANTTNATVTQCNGSGTGGGGTVNCSVGSTSKVSPAIPIRISQCNGTGNPGGSTVTCQVTITTNLTDEGGTTTTTTGGTTSTSGGTHGTSGGSDTSGTKSRTTGTTGTTTSSSPKAGTSATGTTPDTTTPHTSTPITTAQVSRVPTGGIQAGGGSTSGFQHRPLLGLGVALMLLAVGAALVSWRATRKA